MQTALMGHSFTAFVPTGSKVIKTDKSRRRGKVKKPLATQHAEAEHAAKAARAKAEAAEGRDLSDDAEATNAIKKVVGEQKDGIDLSPVERCGRPKVNSMPCRSIVKVAGQGCCHHPDKPAPVEAVPVTANATTVSVATEVKIDFVDRRMLQDLEDGKFKMDELIEKIQDRTGGGLALKRHLRTLRATLNAFRTKCALEGGTLTRAKEAVHARIAAAAEKRASAEREAAKKAQQPAVEVEALAA